MRDKSKKLTVINTGSERFEGLTEKEIQRLVSARTNLFNGGDGSIGGGLSGEYLSSEKYDEAKGVINFLEGLMIDGRLVDKLLREKDNEGISDTNIMTSSRVVKELSRIDDKYLRKDKDDRSSGIISSNKGFEVGRYVSGASGAIVYVDSETGHTVGELDKLYVRMKAYFETLEIVNVNTIGGKQILSPGGSVKCLGVEETEDAYRCYFLAELDGEKIENRFVVNDQIYSQTFDAVEGVSHNVSNHYFWRLCTAVAETEVEFEGKKCWWIDLSKTDADNAVWNSDIPVAGDILNQRGNRTDLDRMNFIEQSSVDAYSPNITLFHGVNSYSLDGKEYVSLGVDKSSNKAFMNVYGSMYVGDRNKTSYMKYTPEDGLEINGRLNVGVKLGDTPLKDLISAASPEGYQEFIEKVTGDIEGLQQQIDGAIESYFYQYSPSLENYPAASWNTDDKKKAHLNDTFTNLNDGRSWRWTVNNGVYGWTEITDTATAQALALAGKAKDTADGKRRVFTNTPYPPYDEGDLWAGGSTSPLKVCVKSKTETQLFDESDWAYADNTEKLRDEMSTLVSTTKTELNTSIASTKTAMEGYTDNAKKALQQSIDLLEIAKADIDNVYSIADADGKISAAEAEAIKKAEELADAARVLAETNVQAWADGEISAAEQSAIEEAQKRVDAAKSELEAAIAEIDSKYAKLVAETKGELNNEIGQATVAANNYTDAAKTALQGAIDELNKAKANITEVYSIAEADGKISASEQAAINASKEQADAAIALSETTIKAYADGVVDKEEAARIKQAEENLAAAKEYAEEKAKEARDEIKNSYLFQALTEAPGTTIENGLILSSLIQLRDQGGNIKSGINGTINDSKGDKSIANWWGGNMDDMTDYYTWDGTQWVKKSGVTVPSDLPKGLIRMDGTGYLAKGKFWWDNNGKIYADPTALFLMFDVEDESASLSQTILNLRDKQTEFTDMWELRTDIHGNKYLYSKHPLVTQGGVTMYADGGDLDIPSIYDGLPIDGTTIYWENGILKAKGGGSGSISEITKQMVIDALEFTPISSSDVPTSLPNPHSLKFGSKLYDGSASKTILASDLGITWDDILGRPTLLSSFTDDVVAGKYLPLSGGTLTGEIKFNIADLIYKDISAGIIAAFKAPRVQINELISNYIYLGSASQGNSSDSPLVIRKYSSITDKSPSGTTDLVTINTSGNVTALGGFTGNLTGTATKATTADSATYAESAGNANALDNMDSTDFFRILGINNNIDDFGDDSKLNGIVYINADNGEAHNAPFSYGSVLSINHKASSWMIGCQYKGKLMYRHRWWSESGENWSAWKTIAFTDSDITGNAASATKLSTPRTIWGQSFDGSGNVSGSINLGKNAIGYKLSDVWTDDEGNTHPWYGLDFSTPSKFATLSNWYGIRLNVGDKNEVITNGTFVLSNDSPSIIFRGGTTVDDYCDWTIINIGGYLTFKESNQGNERTALKMCYTQGIISDWNVTAPNFIGNLTGTATKATTADSATYAESAGNANALGGFDAYRYMIAVPKETANINSVMGFSDNSPFIARLADLSQEGYPAGDGGYGNLVHFGVPGRDTAFQLYSAYSSHRLLYRMGTWYADGSGTVHNKAWKTIAFTDSDITGNAATATKLQTARTIFGQSFDGTGNVEGDSKANSFIATSSNGLRLAYGNYGTLLRNDGSGFFILLTNSGGALDGSFNTLRPFKIDLATGDIQMESNVFITKSFKLSKRLRVDARESATSFGYMKSNIANRTNIGIAHLGTNYGGTSDMTNEDYDMTAISMYRGIVGIGKEYDYTSLKAIYDAGVDLGLTKGLLIGSAKVLYVNNELNISTSAYINGNILTTGGVTMYSQRNLKNITDERGLSLDELRTIKPTRYTWKDGRDNRIHFGGIADDIQQVLPEVVYNANGVLTMDYGNAGFAIASSLIKPVIDHEQRIKTLEKENEELKQEIKRLKA